MVADVMSRHGDAEAAIAPLGFLAAQLAALTLLYLRPRPRTAVLFIIVSVACVVGYEAALYSYGPTMSGASQYLANRPIVALCAIGAVTGTPVSGIQWSTAGLLAGEVASTALQLVMGRTVELGIGPFLAWLLIVVLMLWIRRSARAQSSVPDPRNVDEETLRLEAERDAEARAASVVHDTVLSDLAAIVHGRVVLTEHDRQHLRQNVARLSAAMSGTVDATECWSVDEELLGVVSDLQWRGLTVEVSGRGSAIAELSLPARTAALDAIRAALENVLAHAGTESADLFIDDNADQVMIMLVDKGRGYDAHAVGGDRLGLRLSIVKRVEDCGGRATVWTQPGVGTSVLLLFPKERRHET